MMIDNFVLLFIIISLFKQKKSFFRTGLWWHMYILNCCISARIQQLKTDLQICKSIYPFNNWLISSQTQSQFESLIMLSSGFDDIEARNHWTHTMKRTYAWIPWTLLISFVSNIRFTICIVFLWNIICTCTCFQDVIVLCQQLLHESVTDLKINILT